MKVGDIITYKPLTPMPKYAVAGKGKVVEIEDGIAVVFWFGTKMETYMEIEEMEKNK